MANLVGITRVRNEELILADTLEHVLARVDLVILYDDFSTDRTVEIALSYDRVHVYSGQSWSPNRRAEETAHRRFLTERAQGQGAEWVWCFDADERIEGELPDLNEPLDAYRFRLLDGYLAEGYSDPYSSGPLDQLPRLWGPEYRDINMLFRPRSVEYRGLDRRQPIMHPATQVGFAEGLYVKHYGKCLSVQHWEDTCNYYATYWPEPYKSKWAARRGKAIHTVSDLGRPLYTWETVKDHLTPDRSKV